MAEYLIQEETLTDISNAIQAKSGETGAIATVDMASRISAIELERSIEVVQVTTNLTLTDEHLGCHLYCTNSSDITIYLPFDVSAGYNCTVERWGTGNVAIGVGSHETLGVSLATINGSLTSVTLGEQYDAAVSILALDDLNISIKGGLA